MVFLWCPDWPSSWAPESFCRLFLLLLYFSSRSGQNSFFEVIKITRLFVQTLRKGDSERKKIKVTRESQHTVIPLIVCIVILYVYILLRIIVSHYRLQMVLYHSLHKTAYCKNFSMLWCIIDVMFLMLCSVSHIGINAFALGFPFVRIGRFEKSSFGWFLVVMQSLAQTPPP